METIILAKETKCRLLSLETPWSKCELHLHNYYYFLYLMCVKSCSSTAWQIFNKQTFSVKYGWFLSLFRRAKLQMNCLQIFNTLKRWKHIITSHEIWGKDILEKKKTKLKQKFSAVVVLPNHFKMKEQCNLSTFTILRQTLWEPVPYSLTHYYAPCLK